MSRTQSMTSANVDRGFPEISVAEIVLVDLARTAPRRCRCPCLPNFASMTASTASRHRVVIGRRHALDQMLALVAQADRIAAQVGIARQRHVPAQQVHRAPARASRSRSPASAPYVFENLGSPTSTGGLIEAWIQAPRPMASATRNRFCSRRSASICVRSDPMAPSGSSCPC